MSSSFYLPGLEDSLRSAMGESCPSLAFVPVLDLPDSQILNLSCWLSLWKSRQSLETLIPSLHNSAGIHLGFSRTWKSPARHDATAGHLHGRWTRKTLKLQNVSMSPGCLDHFRFLANSMLSPRTRPWTLPDGVAAVVEDSSQRTSAYRTTDRRMSKEETRASSSRRVIKCIPLRSRRLWWNFS